MGIYPIDNLATCPMLMSAPSTAGASTAQQRIFPLLLSPLEIHMLADDLLSHPKTFVVRLGFSGEINREAFAAALDEAQQRHPLLRALLSTGKRGLLCWVLADDPTPQLDWGADDAPCTCPRGEWIDLTQEIGLRVWVRQGADRATVLFQFHHACCDGTGAYRFIGDVLAAYGIRTAGGDDRPELGPVQAALLRTRTHRTLGRAAVTDRGLVRYALKQGWKLLSRQPQRLAPPADARQGLPAADFPGFLCLTFDPVEHQRLRSVAAERGGTLNDLLLQDLFRTLAGWNRRGPWRGRRRWLRIMMPTDLRGTEDFEMPAANLTSYTFLARRPRDCARPESLLPGIRNETAMIKHERAGTAFVDMLFMAQRAPRLVPFVVACNFCLATAVLSNAADPTRRFTGRFPRRAGRVVCGNLVLEEITGVPPIGKNTRGSFSVSQYNRRLTISLRCDPHYFRLQDTQDLLALYGQHLRQSAGIEA